MELRHLRYFVAVGEECHFGRAAQRLHVAQSPLSQQIKQLESELGVQLLVRNTRNVALTPAGERYLDRCRRVIASIEGAGVEARRIAAGELGRVAIGFVGSAMYELLPAVSQALRSDLPGVDAEMHGEMLTPSQASALREGHLDIGLVRPPVDDAELEVVPLRDEPLVVALPESHRLARREQVAMGDLREEPFVGYTRRHPSVIHDAVLEACRSASFTPSPTEVGETSTLVSFVAAGLGVALVPRSVRHLRIVGAVYRPLVGPTPTVELSLVTRSGENSAAVERAAQIVGRVVRDLHRDA